MIDAISIVAAGAKETTTGVGFGKYTYMQQITKSKCTNNIEAGAVGTLIDKRDNKAYWVGRMQDGLCWMTQNLDYDGGAVEGYEGSDATILESGSNFSTDTAADLLYYDPGDFVYINGTVTSSCNQPIAESLASCSGWTTIDDIKKNWASTNDSFFVSATHYIGTDGQSICNKEAGSMFGDSHYSQCRIYYYNGYERYAIGNYYNWSAATNSAVITTGSASTSICPTGWKMPVSSSFSALLSGVKATEIHTEPYYFIYGGSINGEAFYNTGSYGYYYTATVASDAHTYILEFNNSSIAPNKYVYARVQGYPVRCVAR